MKMRVKRLDPKAVIPVYATDGAGAFDITAITHKPVSRGIAMYGTGLAFEVPKGHVMLVFSRSGHGFRDHTRLANCVGVVDSDYRGELMVKLVRDDHDDEMPWRGDRVAQGMLVKLPSVEFEEVDELTETKRGTGGMGSTGK